MNLDTHVSIVGRRLADLHIALVEAGSTRKDDAKKVGELLDRWRGRPAPDDDLGGRELEAGELRQGLAGIVGTDSVLEAIDAAMRDGMI